jgi:hypothetical protein
VPLHEKIPVRLLYTIPPVDESEVRFIFELNMFQSVDESAPLWTAEARARESCCPESESPFPIPIVTASWACDWRTDIWEASVEIVVFIDAICHERVAIFIVFVAICPESEAISVVCWDTVPESRSIVFEREETTPEIEFTDEVRFARFPESEAISVVCWDTVPEKEFTVVTIGASVAAKITTWLLRLITCPERASIWGWKLVPL